MSRWPTAGEQTPLVILSTYMTLNTAKFSHSDLYCTEIQKRHQDSSLHAGSRKILLDFVSIGSPNQTGVLRIFVQTSEKVNKNTLICTEI